MSPLAERVMYDEKFQSACQRYAHAGGSSGAIAAAAVNAALVECGFAELVEALKTKRDYIADAAAGHLTYVDSGEGFFAMAKEDLARIDAALAKAAA